MAGIFCDSFDHYSISQISRKWTQEIVGSSNAKAKQLANGRRGTAGYEIARQGGGTGAGTTDSLRLVLPTGDATSICGFAFTVSSSSVLTAATTDTNSNIIYSVHDAGSNQVWFRVNTDGTISAYRGSTLLATTSQALNDNIRRYIEFKVTVDPTSGVAQVRFDSVEVMNFSGNTRNTANSSWGGIQIGPCAAGSGAGAVTLFNYDDLYLCDGTGSENNNFLGDRRVDAAFGSADGDHTEWSLSTGSNHYANIDENPTTDDTDYNYSATVNQRDTVTFNSSPGGSAISFIQLNEMSRKTDAGSSSTKGLFRASSTDYLTSVERGTPSSYAVSRHIFQKNPATSAAWAGADFPVQLGYKKIT